MYIFFAVQLFTFGFKMEDFEFKMEDSAVVTYVL